MTGLPSLSSGPLSAVLWTRGPGARWLPRGPLSTSSFLGPHAGAAALPHGVEADMSADMAQRPGGQGRAGRAVMPGEQLSERSTGILE